MVNLVENVKTSLISIATDDTWLHSAQKHR